MRQESTRCRPEGPLKVRDEVWGSQYVATPALLCHKDTGPRVGSCGGLFSLSLSCVFMASAIRRSNNQWERSISKDLDQWEVSTLSGPSLRPLRRVWLAGCTSALVWCNGARRRTGGIAFICTSLDIAALASSEPWLCWHTLAPQHTGEVETRSRHIEQDFSNLRNNQYAGWESDTGEMWARKDKTVHFTLDHIA